MRSSRHSGPPSSLSGSSRHGLVYATPRASTRGPQLAFTEEGSDKVPTKRKTKLIVILGVALPVLACIIGIAAWAVTTDVLRINPRGNNYNRFGHQGKTRIDNMQSRNDQDVDVFVLHGITHPTSQPPNTITKPNKKFSSLSTTTTSTTGASVPIGQTSTLTSLTASDILSKIISDMPPPKNTKNFVVFSPIPDQEHPDNQRKGRRLDTKVVHDGDDLVAEESVISEETSQETELDKMNYSRKRKYSVDSSHMLRSGRNSRLPKRINQTKKINSNRGIPPEDYEAESPPTIIKRQNGGAIFSTNPKPMLNTLSSRNGGITQHMPNMNFPRNNMPSQNQNNENAFQNFDNNNFGQGHLTFKNSPQTFDNGHPRNMNSQPLPFKQSAIPSFVSSDLSSNIHHNNPSTFPNKETYQNVQQNPQQPPQPLPPQHGNMPSNQYFKDNQRSLSYPNQQHLGSSQNHPSMQVAPPPMYPNTPSQNTFSPDSSSVGGGGPQYFAPPPQNFHTKISYDKPPSTVSQSSPSISTYEKVAQSSVDSAVDGTHHHHHHHHHHEPVAANSDPIGDVNLSDVPRANDADRLGTIGIGSSPARGITVQIGGGGGGGVLGGLLPLGTLGIAKNIISALLPRPQLGLNSKVFLGFEVGRGGGYSMNLG